MRYDCLNLSCTIVHSLTLGIIATLLCGSPKDVNTYIHTYIESCPTAVHMCVWVGPDLPSDHVSNTDVLGAPSQVWPVAVLPARQRLQQHHLHRTGGAGAVGAEQHLQSGECRWRWCSLSSGGASAVGAEQHLQPGECRRR